MGYFDLNIPYLEGEPANPSSSLPENATRNTTRLKIVVKAMELGYTGVAYNRSIKGVMSDKDICTISQFPISSLLKASPNLSTSVKFHREILGVPVNTPFLQYTRLTVSVDSLIQCSALNSVNSVLKTYDLVAARPLNQAAFDYACNTAEVDLISIDFAAGVPFQIKFPSLQSALKRGIYFEIMYSPLISDVQIRRQMIHNTKLLVQWTQGKNLIFTSAAASVSEIRGPCDVANLSSVLGVSIERAKAAISKNCRSLLLNAARKKQCYKNSIKVEENSSTKLVDCKEALFCDGNGWDDISTVEGDFLLDDIAKSFAASSKAPKTSKAIDFASISDEIPSYGMQSKDWLPASGGKVHPRPNLAAAKEFGGSSDTNQVVEELNKLGLDPIAGGMPLASTLLKHQNSGAQDFSDTVSVNDVPEVFTDGKEIETLPTCFEEDNGSDGTASVAVEIMSHSIASEDSAFVTPTKDIQASKRHPNARGSSDLDMIPSSLIHTTTIENNLVDTIYTGEHSIPSKEMAPSAPCNEDVTRLNGIDIVQGAHDHRSMEILSEKEERENANASSAGCDMSINRDSAIGEKHEQCKDYAVSHEDDKMLGESFSELQGDENSHAEFVPSEGASVDPDDRKQFKSGKSRFVRKLPFRPFQFSLKHLWYSTIVKKKPCSRKQNILGNCTDPNMKERFIKLCLQELDNGGRSGEKLKPSSWTRIEEEIKREFGRSYSEKQLKRKLTYMKKQYHVRVNLTSKTGHRYNTARNWSPVTREECQKTRSEAKRFHHSPLQYADDLASSFDSFIVTGVFSRGPRKDDLPKSINAPIVQQCQVPLEEPVDLNSDSLTPKTPHLESTPYSELNVRRDRDATLDGKCRKRRRMVSLQ